MLQLVSAHDRVGSSESDMFVFPCLSRRRFATTFYSLVLVREYENMFFLRLYRVQGLCSLFSLPSMSKFMHVRGLEVHLGC